MTPKTSLVAVCCSSDSVSSRRPRLHFLEQSGVLDGDQCLVCEGLDQFDLPVGERTDGIAGNSDDTQGHIVTHERSREDRAAAATAV